MKSLKQILLLALITTFNSYAQIYPFGRPRDNQNVDSSAIDEIPKFRAGTHFYFGGFIFSNNFMLNDNMKRYLKQSGIPHDYSYEPFVIGIGFTKSKIKLDFEIGSKAFFYGVEKNDNYITRSSAHLGSIYPSFSIFKTRNRTLYFFSGVTYSQHNITIERRQKTPIDFNDLGKVPLTSTFPTLTHNNLLIDFGLQLIHTAKRRRDVVESFKIGYRHGLNERAWTSLTVPITNAPMDRQRMIYAQAHIQISKNYPKK
ncbi:hypothetical protein MCERE19_00133 [Spirosomataceae bacterium]|jgi:hypothetical protein